MAKQNKALDPLTSLPEKESPKISFEDIKKIKGGLTPGYIPGKLREETNIGDLYQKTKLNDQVEGGEYEEDAYYQMLKPGEKITKGMLDNASKMYQLGYVNELKKFKNDLAENQGWYNKIANTWGKYVGKTALNVGGGLLGIGYGVVKGLLTMDSEPLFDNEVFSAVDAGTDWLDRRLVVHGDTKYDDLRNKRGAFGGSFTPRFMHDPLKVIGDDLTDAASFVSGAILTETAAGLLAGPTGGATVVANTARLGAQGARLLRNGTRAMRGLKTLPKFTQARSIANMSNTFRNSIGTVRATAMGAGFEGALIGRETRDRALEGMIAEWEISNPGMEMPDSVKARFEERAKGAGLNSYLLNTALVGASNFIQFGSVFNKFKGKSRAFKGLGLEEGKFVSRAPKGMAKIATYGYKGLKSPITEAFEEFSQGVLEHGIAEYHISDKSADSVFDMLNYGEAISHASSRYFDSIEGRDSMTLGFLMGLIGMPLGGSRANYKKARKEGKGFLKSAWQGFEYQGGSVKEMLDQHRESKKLATLAEKMNENMGNHNALKTNFKNAIRQNYYQGKKDKALEDNDAFAYKNAEHDNLFSYVMTRRQLGREEGTNGLEDTIFQEIEALRKVSLDEFNKTYAAPGVPTFTEATRAKELDVLEKRVESIIDTANDVELMFSQNATKEMLENPGAYYGLQEQLIHSASSIDNLNEREQELETQISNLSNGIVGSTELNDLVGNTVKLKGEQLISEFDEKFDEVLKNKLDEWQKGAPGSYAKNKMQVKELMQDLKEIKKKRKLTGEYYEMLMTPKGQKRFSEFHNKTQKQEVETVKGITDNILDDLYKNATTQSELEHARKQEVSVTGKDSRYQFELDNQVKKAVDEAEAAISDQKAQKNKDGEVVGETMFFEEPAGEVTDEEVIERIEEIKGENSVYTQEEFNNIKSLIQKERADKIRKDISSEAIEETPVSEIVEIDIDKNDPVLKALSKNRLALNKILNDIGGIVNTVNTADSLSDEQVLDNLIEALKEDSQFAEDFQIATIDMFKNIKAIEQEGRAVENPANPKDAEEPTLISPSIEEADKINLSILNVEPQLEESKEVKGEDTILRLHDKVPAGGKIIYDKETGLPKDNTNKSKQEVKPNFEVLNGPKFLSDETINDDIIEVEIRPLNTKYNRDGTSGKYNSEYGVFYGEVYLGKLPGGEIKKGSANLQALKEALYEANKEYMSSKYETGSPTSIKVKLKRKTYGHINVRKGAKHSPLKVIKDYQKKSGQSRLVVGIKLSEEANSIAYSNVTEDLDENPFDISRFAANLPVGKVFMIVPSANGEMVPVMLFTNKLEDCSDILKTKIKKNLEKLSNPRIADNTRNNTLKELNSFFQKKNISFDKATGVYTIKDLSNGGKTVATQELEIAYETLSKFLVRVPYNQGGKALNTFARTQEEGGYGVLTTNSEVMDDGNLFHSTGFILDDYVPASTQEDINNAVKDNTSPKIDNTKEKQINDSGKDQGYEEDADIEKRRKDKLEKPYKTINDGSGTMVTITTETTEKDGIKKTKFKTQTTNKKGEPRTQNNKGYNTFEEAVENLGIDLESEENETALELVEILKEEQGKETIPTRVEEIRESMDKSSPFFGMKTATIIVGSEKIEFRLKSDAELAALETTTDTTTEEGTTTSFLDDLGDEGSGLGNDGTAGEDTGAMRVTMPKTDAREWDAEKEIKWLKSRLGKHIVENSTVFSDPEQLKGLVSEETYKMLLEVGKNGKILQGLFTDAGLYLLDKAFTGTAYHEAFHVVFRLSLNNEQRTALLKEARDKFKDELDENATDIEVEELLADKFMDYVQSEQADSTVSKKINNFFKRLSNMLRRLFGYNNQVTVQGIFSDIELGVYKNKPKFKNTDLSEFTRFSTRDDVRNNNSELFANNPEIRKDALDYMREMYFSIIDNIRKNNPSLAKATDIEIIQKQGVNKLNNLLLLEIAKDTKSRISRGSENAKKAFTELWNELTNKEQNIKGVKKENKLSLQFTKPTQLLQQFTNYLAKDGIIISLKDVKNSKEDFNNNQVKVEEEDNTLEEAWYRGIAKINPKDTLTQRLKRFFDTIPVYSSNYSNATPLSNYFGAAQTENGNEIFKYLVENISGTKNTEDMMEKLRSLEKTGKPYVSRIVNELRANPTIKSDLWIHIGSKSFMKYTFVLNTLYKNSDGSIKTNSFQIFDSNRKSLDTIVLEDLQSNFLNQQNKLFLKETSGLTKGKRNFNKIDSKELNNLKEVIRNFNAIRGKDSRTIVSEKDLQSFSKELNKYGFLFSSAELNKLQSGVDTKAQHAKFATFINSLEKIVNQFDKGQNPFLFNQASLSKKEEEALEDALLAGENVITTIGKKDAIKELAKSLKPVYEGQIQAAFRNIDNETVYNLQPSSFLTKKIRTFKKGKDLLAFIEETSSDPLFQNSPLLADLKESGAFRNELQVSILDGIKLRGRDTGTGYTGLSDIEYARLGMALYKNGNATNYGYYNFPIPADSGTMPLIKLQKLDESEIGKKLLQVAKGEFISIKKIKDLRKTSPDAEILQVENFDKNSEQFNTLDFLNKEDINFNEEFSSIEGDIEIAIDNWINEMFEKEIEQFMEKGIILEKGANLKFADGVIADDVKDTRQFFRDFILNSFYANTQLTTLFSGSPAFYKGSVNYQKRNKQTQAQVTYLDTLRPGVDAEYNVVYLKDIELKTKKETLEAIKKLVNDSKLSKQKKKELIAQWTSSAHNITDGQTFISPSRYRTIMEGLNRMTPDIEAALKRVEQGIESVKDAALLPPIKPFMFTQKNIDGFIVPVQHKNSETLLTKSMANLKDPKTGEIMSPTLQRAYNMMNPEKGKSKIDALMFESAVKVGGVKIIDFEDLNENNVDEFIQKFSNSDYGLQQETPAHYIDDESKYGSQLRNIIIEDIDVTTNNKLYTLNGKAITGKQLVESYQDLIATDYEAAFNSVRDLFQNKDGTINYPKLLTTLKREVEERNLGQSFLDALDEFKTASGEVTSTLPFIHPMHSYRIESMLNSIFKNRITQQKINGGAMVNVSSFGVAENLDFKIDEKTGIAHMEVLMPWWSKKMFPTKANGEVNFDALDQEGLLDIIGYRIPTEHKYSMFKMKPVGFTPYSQGGTLIMPREVTTQAGLDFDIDKIYLMIPAFRKNSEGKLEKIKYSTDSNVLYDQYIERIKKTKEAKELLAEQKLNEKTDIRSALKGDTKLVDKFLAALGLDVYENEDNNVDLIVEALEEEGKILTEEEFKAQSIEMQNTKQARDNRKIEIVSEILSNKESLEDILDPGNFDALKAESARMRLYALGRSKEAETLSMAELIEKNKELDEEDSKKRNINLPSTQLEFFRRNMTGRDLTGIEANHKSHNAKAQYTNLSASYEIKLGGKVYQALNIIKKDDGPKVSKMLATFVAAVVDNANEPISSFINFNTYTADTASFLTRLGMDFKTTFAFLNQPEIKKLTQKFYNQRGSISDSALTKKLLKEAKTVLKQKLNLPSSYNELNTLMTDISTKELQEGLKKGANEDSQDDAYLKIQLAALIHFEQHKKAADELSRAVRAGKADTQGVGPTQAANYVFLENQQRVKKGNKDSLLRNAAEVFDYSEGSMQKMMPAANEFGVILPAGILDKIFPYNGTNNSAGKFVFNILGEIKNSFSRQKGFFSLSEKEASSIQNAYLTYIASGFDFFDNKNSRAVIEKLPQQLLEYKTKNPGKYKLLLESLRVTPSDKNIPINRIQFYNTGVTTQDVELVKLSWEAMLRTGTEEDIKLARNLVRYAFFQSGFEFNSSSFLHLVPVSFWAELKNENGQSFNDYLRAAGNTIRNLDENGQPIELPKNNSGETQWQEYNLRFLQQYARNNAKSSIFKSIDINSKTSPGKLNKDGTLTLTVPEAVSDYYTYTESDQSKDFVSFIKFYDSKGNLKFFTLKNEDAKKGEFITEGRQRTTTYVPLETLGTPSFLKEYDYFSNIPFSVMKGKSYTPEYQSSRSSAFVNNTPKHKNPDGGEITYEEKADGSISFPPPQPTAEVRYDSLGNELELAGDEIVRKEDGSTYEEFDTVEEAKAAFEKLSLQPNAKETSTPEIKALEEELSELYDYLAEVAVTAEQKKSQEAIDTFAEIDKIQNRIIAIKALEDENNDDSQIKCKGEK